MLYEPNMHKQATYTLSMDKFHHVLEAFLTKFYHVYKNNII
jgi:hypothetical protein